MTQNSGNANQVATDNGIRPFGIKMVMESPI